MPSPEMSHSGLGPSGAKRWLNCPASVEHLEKHPMPQSAYAAEGTGFHEAAYAALMVEDLPEGSEDFEQDAREYATIIHNIESEMIECSTSDVCLVAEKPVALKSIDPEAFGTPDCYLFEDFGELHVFDAKGGWQFVDSEANEQLMYYALAIIEEHNINPSIVYLHIYQPARESDEGPLRTSKVSMQKLNEFHQELKAGVKRVKGKNPAYKLGDWCQFCNKAECPEQKKEIQTVTSVAIDGAPEQVKPNLATYDNERLVRIKKMQGFMTGIFRDVDALLHQRGIEERQEIPGMKVIRSFGNRRWKDDTGLEGLAKTLGIDADEFFVKKPKSPAQVEKHIKAEFPARKSEDKDFRAEAMGHFEGAVEKKYNGLILVEENAKGEPVMLESFDDIT